MWQILAAKDLFSRRGEPPEPYMQDGCFLGFLLERVNFRESLNPEQNCGGVIALTFLSFTGHMPVFSLYVSHYFNFISFRRVFPLFLLLLFLFSEDYD